MAWTQAQHDALEAAIAQGALRVKYEDRDITYESTEKMQALLGKMKASLGLVPRNHTLAFKASFDKET